MKKILFPLWLVALALTLCTACSDDDDEKLVAPIQETSVFQTGSGLTLTLNGNPIIGQQVTFVPDAQQADKAQLTIVSDFDPSQLLTRSDLPVRPTGAGLLPGTPILSLPLALQISGDECSFQGSSETEYCTFSYSGRASRSALQLDFTDVKLKNTKLAGTTWSPLPYDSQDYTQEPIHIVWEAAKGIELFPGYEMPLQSLLSLMVRLPLIEMGNDQEVSVNEMLNYAFRSVSFGADGQIGASYVDVANEGTSVLQAPYGVAQYLVLDDSHLKVYLNPTMIAAIAKANDAATRAGVDETISSLLPTLLNLLVEGVPVEYRLDGNNLQVYLDTQLLLPLIQAVVPLLQDEELINLLMQQIASDPDMAGMADSIIAAFKSLPAVIGSTTRIEIGLNLARQK